MAPARRRSPVAALVLVVAALTVALAAVSCTSRTWDTSEIDGATATTVPTYTRDEAGLTASLTDYLSTVGDDLNEWAPPRDQAECAAGRLVRRLTVDHLLELGFDPQEPTLALDYPADERVAVINIVHGCIDVAEGLLEMYSSYLKLPLTQSNCMAEGFSRLGLDRDVVASLVDGTEPDPFANENRYAAGVSSLAVECMEPDDLLPNAPMPPLPDPPASSTSTTSTTEPPFEDDGLEGIVPGGPLDTTTTTIP